MNQNERSLNKHILRRPRLNSLIHEGLEHPLLVMLAAPGYGKTQALTDYVEGCRAKVLWMHLSMIDNLPDRFWTRLITLLKRKYPELSECLKELTFPDSIYTFNAFAKVMDENICTNERVIWVFDDYGVIDNRQIKDFITMLVDSHFEDFHIALLSNEPSRTESIAFMTNKQSLILADDLRFNKNEIRELYRIHSIKLSENELDALERYTEGWPMPLCLLMFQSNQLSALMSGEEKMTHQVISHLFEERFFSSYSTQQQKLIVKLSMMESFTKTFINDSYEGDIADLEKLKSNAFFINTPGTGRFYLHNLYRSFLQQKTYLLTPAEEKDFWKSAAKYYMDSADALEAIHCYHKAGDHESMLNAIKLVLDLQVAVNYKTASYFLEYIALLTDEELKKYPIADYLRALIYMHTYRLDKAEALVINLEKRLSQAALNSPPVLLAETYITHGLIRMMRAQDDFGQYYKKAGSCLHSSAVLSNSGGMKVYNHFSFFMPDNYKGAKQRIERAIHSDMPCYIKIMKGSMSGMPHLFSSEVSYLSYEMEDAKQHAYRAVYTAEANRQHDLACNAYTLLAKISYIKGDFKEMSSNIQSIVQYAKKCELSVINEIRDTTLAWYYLKMKDLTRVPKSIIMLDNKDRDTISYGRLFIVYGYYLAATDEHAKLIGLLEYLKDTAQFKYITQERISLYIMLAIAYLRLEKQEDALGALWIAYNMCYNNSLTTPFIQEEKNMLDLIDIARKQSRYTFAPGWLDTIENESASFSKRANQVCTAYRKQNPVKVVKDNPLSKREVTVLEAVARGLTREEIALEQYISMNTVKSTIKSIFNKLNSNNKAAAVSIAIAKGYINGHMQEY